MLGWNFSACASHLLIGDDELRVSIPRDLDDGGALHSLSTRSRGPAYHIHHHPHTPNKGAASIILHLVESTKQH